MNLRCYTFIFLIIEPALTLRLSIYDCIAEEKTKLIYCLHNISSKKEMLIFLFSLFLPKNSNFIKKHSQSLCNENIEDFSDTNEIYWRRSIHHRRLINIFWNFMNKWFFHWSRMRWHHRIASRNFNKRFLFGIKSCMNFCMNFRIHNQSSSMACILLSLLLLYSLLFSLSWGRENE